MVIVRYIAVCVCFFVMVSCGGKSTSHDTSNIQPVPDPIETDSPPDNPKIVSNAFLQQCTNCHGEDGTGPISLINCSQCGSLQSLTAYIAKSMPPEAPESCVGECATETANKIFSDFVETLREAGDPARVTIRRLNKAEYQSTVAHLFSVTSEAIAQMPEENISHGFDNMADALVISPLHLELYNQAASEIADKVFESVSSNQIRERVITCDASTTTCRQQVIAQLSEKLWRRTPTQTELQSIYQMMSQITHPDLQLKAGLHALLLSPHFLFKVELDDTPENITPHRLNSFELATRLSYFIWSSAPDEALLTLAKSDSLLSDDVVKGQVMRMLADPKASALTDRFAAQWLNTQVLATHDPDLSYFPDWNNEIAGLMQQESLTFFNDIVENNRPMTTLLTANYTFLNAPLAKFYGIEGVSGKSLQKVSLVGTNRQGLLTQGSVLAGNSFPTRTSLVRRGKWVMDALLCNEPDAPPPGVENLPAQTTGTTLRDQLEQHRSDPVCASCHAIMDNIGFAFENFDGIGQWRTFDGDAVVDAKGELPDGSRFSSAIELSAILAADPDYAVCVAKKLTTYAIGRELDLSDSETLHTMAANWSAQGMQFKQLVSLIATSHLFNQRRGEAQE